MIFVWLTPHVRCTPMEGYVRGPDEIGLTPMGVKLNGSGGVQEMLATMRFMS